MNALSRNRWERHMRDARRNRYMAGYAMPRELRPTFARMARADMQLARNARTLADWGFA